MKQIKVIWLLVIFIVTSSLMFSSGGFAGGLYLSQVNSPVSLGTAGVFNVVNNVAADAAYTNPAGMTGIEKDTIMLGFQIMFPEARFEASTAGKGGEDGGNAGEIAVVPGLSAVKILSDKWRLGLAVTAPLGGGVDYGDNFVGRYGATRAFLSGLGISPSVGYKINESVSVGLGVTAIYTNFDMDVAINRGPFPDGRVSINQIDDWSPQGFAGLTWQVTDRALLGFVYRTKSKIELEGDLDFEGLRLLNRITSSLDRIEVDFDVAPVYAVGLAYKLTESLKLIVDLDYEEWSEFSDNYISIRDNAITTAIDRNWDDTWHAGVAALYKMDDSLISAGIAYDSSAVDDEDRTFDIPVDEQLKLGVSYAGNIWDNFSYAFGLSYVWLGEGKIDQTVQKVRVEGEFDKYYFVSVGGNIRYMF